MKILLTNWCREWRGSEPQVLKPETLPLENQNIWFALVVSLGNGEYDELCLEFDTLEAKERIEGLICGTGNARRVGASPAVALCRLYRSGYEVYMQGRKSYFFLNPVPRPELFERRDLSKYLAEFQPA